MRLCLFNLRVKRCFSQAHADVESKDDEKSRQQERNSPAPVAEGFFTQSGFGSDDDEQGQNQSDGGRHLDVGGVTTALIVGRVLGHVDGCSAVLTAERKPLETSQQHDKDYRCDDAGRLVCG